MLLVEKDTIEPIASKWQMPFASSRGYSSLTLQHDVAKMLIGRHAKTGQTGRIYFISDLDPSGLDLQRAWKDALRNFGVRFKLARIALTPEQVGNLGDDALREGISVKPSDSRAKSYIDRYDERCWGADILPASSIRQTLESDLLSWFDADLWRRRDAEIEQTHKLL